MASGRSISRVSRLLDVSRPTLYKWRNQVEQTAKVETQPPRPPIPQQKIEDWQAFREVAAQHGEVSTKPMAPWGNISCHTISRGLRKIAYTPKNQPTTTSNEMKNPRL
ncbi:MAG: hypothetical protein BRC43_10470, partial [Cyanobacteria bacterium QS_3_48_167]